MYKSTQKYNYANMKDQTGSTNSMEIVQGNLLKGIDNKTVKRKGILICLCMFSFQEHTVYINKTKWL